jgi:hypothetical protein
MDCIKGMVAALSSRVQRACPNHSRGIMSSPEVVESIVIPF